MKRPIAPDLEDNPRIPTSWSRDDIARELRKERTRCAEEMTENRALRTVLREMVEQAGCSLGNHEVFVKARRLLGENGAAHPPEDQPI